jgi:hypothetical protein
MDFLPKVTLSLDSSCDHCLAIFTLDDDSASAILAMGVSLIIPGSTTVPTPAR